MTETLNESSSQSQFVTIKTNEPFTLGPRRTVRLNAPVVRRAFWRKDALKQPNIVTHSIGITKNIKTPISRRSNWNTVLETEETSPMPTKAETEVDIEDYLPKFPFD